LLRKTTMAGLLACSTALAAPLPPEPLAYVLSSTLPIGAPDSWDYLAYDADTQNLFVSHGTQVTVVSTSSARSAKPHAETLSVVGTIGGLDGAHGIAIVPGGLGYVASGKAGTVVAFDLDKLRAVKTIAAGPGPDALAYDPASRHLFAMNGDAGRITVIDTRSNTAVGAIAAGGHLEAAAADGQGNLFVNQTDTGSLLRIDTATNMVSKTWKLPDCTAPHGLALDQWNHRVFVSCENTRLLVVSGTTGRVLTQTEIGRGSDTVAYDADRHMVFSSNGDGTLSALSAVSLLALQPLITAPGARTMAVDPVSGRVFLVTADITGPAGEKGALWPRWAFVPGTLKVLVFSPAS
jgi:DNA-binding beta-propeller fold protein YncE